MEANKSSFKRIKVEKEDDLVKVIIKPKLKVFTTLILLIFFFIWSISGIIILANLYMRDLTIINNTYILLWFFAWLIGELFFIYSIFWRIVGKEVLIKNSSELQYFMDIAGFTTMTSFDLSKISNVVTKTIKPDIYQLLGIEFLSPQRSVLFNYGTANKDFGISLSDEEINFVIENLDIIKNQD